MSYIIVLWFRLDERPIIFDSFHHVIYTLKNKLLEILEMLYVDSR